MFEIKKLRADHVIDFAAEELTGEAINDAKFNRNVAVGDKLNVVITTLNAASAGHDAGFNEVTRDVQAGTASFDLLTACGYTTSKLSMNNYLVDLGSVPYIDLEASWWDQIANKDLKVLDQLFYTTGDITVIDNDAIWVMMFNKQMAQNQDYDLYQLVRDNKWYYETMYDMVKNCAKDLNGDGKMTWQDDQYGFATTNDSAQGLMYASGVTLSSKDSDDYPIIHTDMDKLTSVIVKAGEIMSDANTTIITTKNGITTSDDLRLLFEGGRALFFGEVMACVTRMRNSTTDFGLIPYPKYDEAQKDYLAYVNAAGNLAMIPSSAENPERTGLLTEALAAGAYDMITPSLYEIITKSRNVRDEESAEMVSIITSNIVYDTFYLNLLDGYSILQERLTAKSESIASALESKRSAAEKSLEKLVEAYKSMN